MREIEEMYFRQKSRINWLKEGDLNTAYFHRICQTRACYNATRAFLAMNGVWITDPQEMTDHAVNHFQSVLGPQNYQPLQLLSHPYWFAELTGFVFPSHLRQAMLTIPSDVEIKNVIFRLNQNKAPGPDGLISAFFKATWEFIGEEVTTSIKKFFAMNFLPATANSTILFLVPKFPGATKISDFRPISCLNTIYKVISRIVVKRLKPVLSALILPSQTSFVQGRLLVENTTLAGELINGYHKNKGEKRIAIKVDIAKAFDTLSWEFLFSCLEGLGFPERYIRQLKACVCTTSFMVGYNGNVHVYFKGKRGLRQGDPLSPYLFVIAMNCLSHMLNRAAMETRFAYHTRCASTKLTHLSFADDLLIFIDGSVESVQQVLQVLKEFEHRSGLTVSMEKTSFYSSDLTQAETDLIQVSTGMSLGSLPIRYLGVPMNSKKLSLTSCEPLIHQIKTKFSSWSVKSLSFAGRLLLIKAVIAGINTFWCSAFILPKACIARINSLCGQFLWKGSLEGSHTARVSWETVVLTKRQGGLGVKDLRTWNRACAIRLIWLLFFRPDSVWVQWFKEVILKGSVHNYWSTTPKQSYSWLVNKLLKMKTVVFPLMKLRPENGETAQFWTDNWTPFGDLITHLSSSNSRLRIPRNATVSSLCPNGSWILPPCRTEAQAELYSFLTMVQLTQNQDYYEWEINGQVHKTFQTGKLYDYLMEPHPDVYWSNAVWFSRAIPRHSFHMWLVVQNRIPTRDRLLHWGIQVDDRCLLCNQYPESRDHLFFSCAYSYDLWRLVTARLQILLQRTWGDIIAQMTSLSSPIDQRLLTLLAWEATVHWISNERNTRLHASAFRTTDQIFKLMDRQLRNKLQSFRESNPVRSSSMMQRWILLG